MIERAQRKASASSSSPPPAVPGMYEGVLSLMQMAETCGALARHSQARLLYISLSSTHPTFGGVSASFATIGDLILAEPKAMVGFAGPRVIKETTHQSLPPGFQTAEFLEDHGLVDKIVHQVKRCGRSVNCSNTSLHLHVKQRADPMIELTHRYPAARTAPPCCGRLPMNYADAAHLAHTGPNFNGGIKLGLRNIRRLLMAPHPRQRSGRAVVRPCRRHERERLRLRHARSRSVPVGCRTDASIPPSPCRVSVSASGTMAE